MTVAGLLQKPPQPDGHGQSDQDDKNKIRVKRHPEDKHRAFHQRRPLDKLVFNPPDNLDQIAENQDHGIGEQQLFRQLALVYPPD